LGFDVPALLCCIFVLYHLLSKKDLREAIHNHVWIIILLLLIVYEVIPIPQHLQYFMTGVVRPSTPMYCLVWWFIDWGFYYTISVLLLFASIERHFLIFHSQMTATTRKRLIFHYLPLIVIILFMMVFYIVAIFAPGCESTYDYTVDLCGMYPCSGSMLFFQIFEGVVFSIVLPIILTITNLILLIRVVWQKYRVHRSVQWKKQRKLAIQVIFMSSIYLLFNLPPTIVYLVRVFRHSASEPALPRILFYYSYMPTFVLPFGCLTTLPKFWDIMEKLDPRKRQVAPPPPIPQI